MMMEFTGERYIPVEHNIDELSVEHLHRYYSILPYIKNKVVLDIACGEGYGSALIAKTATQVVGVDISKECILHAQKTYAQNTNISFKEGAAEKIPAPDHAFDVVVSFETIEHLSENGQKEFLAEIKRVLKKEGSFIVSTPDKENYSERYHHENHFHVHELKRDEFVTLINNYFAVTTVFEQGFDIVSAITPADFSGIENLRLINWQNKPHPKKRKYLIAIASDAAIDEQKMASVVLETDKDYFKQVDRIFELQDENEERTAWALRLDKERVQNEAIINVLKEQVQSAPQQQLQALTSRIETLQQWLFEQDSQKQTQINNLTADVAQYKKEIGDQLAAINKLHGENKKLEERLQEHEKVLFEKQQLEEKLKKHEQLIAQNKQLEEKVSLLSGVVKDNERILQDLQFNYSLNRQQLSDVNNKLVTIYDSEGWKMLAIYYSIKGKLLHEDSKHYKVLKNTVNFLRNKKDPFTAVRNTHGEKKQEAITQEKKEIPVRTLPYFENPVVSIIIPVYNAWEMNEKCIVSILEHTSGIAYEVIIADDCSFDETKEVTQYFKNIVQVRNKQNLGFLLNCNNAATHAKGKYIHFLNNDTEVKEGWLSALVRLMENDEEIGMAGSKLIYPDGHLQEAGGIIWNDASGWNFGHKQNPDEPTFNYVKEVDYISGASIMVRSKLWNEIGGFDPIYTPAYFEDTDLAFEIRKRGYKVVYQPLSEVIHYEGYSHGSETNGTVDGKSIKAYQQINKDKFFEKWKKTLKQEHFANAENVFWARDKSKDKKTILVIDHYVPHFDKDAGSRHTFQYLELFKSLDLNIKFIGDNFYKHEPYTTVLQQMGVEVLYGVYYRDHWQQWILDNKEKIDYVYLNRPHISIKYIDFIKQNTKAKILYFGHDLHFFRELKQYEIEKKPELLASAEQWKKTEMYLFNKSDVIITPSEKEKIIIKELVPNKNVQSTRLFLYKSLNSPISKFENRMRILFVGGFNHKPNVDGVLWFIKEVWPDVALALPDATFTIVGSHAPESIQNLASDNVYIKGFVSDNDLKQLYHEARMVVIPLRYGAGVKGKVLEAMYYGVPLVTTDDGVEGLPGDVDFLKPVNDPRAFARTIIEYYNAEEKLINLSRQEVAYMRQNFHWDTAKKIFMDILELQ